MPSISISTTLRNDRVTLRVPSPGDVDSLTELCQDPEIPRWTRVPSPFVRAHAQDLMFAAREDARRGIAAHFVIEDERGEVVGYCGLEPIDWPNLVGDVVGWVGADHRGRGIMSNAVVALAAWAGDELGLERLQAYAPAPHPAANAVLRNAGFDLEGRHRSAMILSMTGTPGSPRVDLNVYGRVMASPQAPLTAVGDGVRRGQPGFETAPAEPRQPPIDITTRNRVSHRVQVIDIR